MTINIRNFAIIAHIDHGKSTLADRLLEITKTVEKRKIKEQFLDNLEVERERGVTIKLQTVRMKWKEAGQEYILNLIDTPGHIDFYYEVSRALAACEGALLLVDATQGIQAQTINHALKALTQGLTLIPVINKIDLPYAQIEETANQICTTFGFAKDEIIYISAKTGENVEKVLQKIVEKIPPPKGNNALPLQALVFDSFYDPHKGVVLLIKVENGELKDNNRRLILLRKNKIFTPLEWGYLLPSMTPQKSLLTGEVGYIATGCKDIQNIRVGDTVSYEGEKISPLPGYKPPTPMVFADIFPLTQEEFLNFKKAFEKLALNDAAIQFNFTSHPSLGRGYKCGFLGIFHLEVVKERLEKEFNIDTLITAPSVSYKIVLKSKKSTIVENPQDLPEVGLIDHIEEPWVIAEIITPYQSFGQIVQLVAEKRGSVSDTTYLSPTNVMIKCEMPLNELITDTFERINSISHGYASIDYTFSEYKPADIVKLDILVNKEIIKPLSILIHRERAAKMARHMVNMLKDLIPRHQFPIPIQAAIGTRVLARENIPAYRKDVLAGMSGGDVRRKIKKLEKQKEGKKKLRAFGKVSIPPEAFLSVVSKDYPL